ncbi:MAG: cyclic nucleotide-binding domain-containing protein [Anaerolineae bacterium]|nr:cyclic nucleotide-binding domain-containing protein [Anaerolineae bacterium]MDW8172288.1 cyclic nucleotide-binding domain-containing protein [Anaerolineae bacterium]
MPQSQAQIAQALSRVPLFSGLASDSLMVLAQACQLRSYQFGEVLFQQGEMTRGLHLILAGQARLIQNLPNDIQAVRAQLGPGQFINEGALHSEGYQTSTLIAFQPTLAALLTREAFNNVLAYYPAIKTALQAQGGLRQRPRQFEGQRENETVLLKTNRHWWVWVRWAWLPAVLVLFGLGFGLSLGGLAWLMSGFLALVALGWLVYLYAEWANDSVIISDQRILRKTQHILRFEEKTIEIKLDSVQEVKIVDPGLDIFSRLFNYGTLSLVTAGQAGNLRLSLMPRAQEIQTLILRGHQQAQRGQARDVQAMRADIERWLQGGEPAPSGTPQTTPEADKEAILGRLPRSPFASEFLLADGRVVYRQHWFVWWRAILAPSGLIASGLGLALLGLVLQLGIISLSIGLLMTIVGAAWWWFVDWDFRNDVLILSDHTIRILHERPLWLDSTDQEILLSRVDNVVVRINGFWRQLLGYGNLELSLTGADDYKPFDNLARPKHVQAEIMRRQAAAKQRQQASEQEQQRQIIGEYLRLYHEMVSGQRNPDASASPLPSLPTYADPAAPSPAAAQPQPLQRPALSAPRPFEVPTTTPPSGTQALPTVHVAPPDTQTALTLSPTLPPPPPRPQGAPPPPPPLRST